MITVEYLLPFNTEDGICADINSFKALLSTNSNFKVKNKKIKYNTSTYEFEVYLSKVEDKECSVFHVKFGISRLTSKFREMLKVFRKTVGMHLKDNIQIIWDGVSFECSKELYPQIYETENSLRMLISKFMLTKIGIGWHKSSIPKDVSDSIKTDNFKPTHGILYEVDFIQLANFLFKSYSVKDASKLPNILSKIIEDGMDEDKKNEILEYLPKNNWDRYFSELVEIDSRQLKKQWESLYKIRCKVAHNKSMQFEDFERAKKLLASLDTVFEKAHENLSNIEIPEEVKESVGLRTLGIASESVNHFVNSYMGLSDYTRSLIQSDKEKYGILGDYDSPISGLIINSNSDTFKFSSALKDSLYTIDNYKNELFIGATYKNPWEISVNDNIFQTAVDGLNSAFKVDDIRNKGIVIDKPSFLHSNDHNNFYLPSKLDTYGISQEIEDNE